MSTENAPVSLTDGFHERIISEIDFTHEWVGKYRVPVVRDLRVGAYIIAGLVVPDENDKNFWGYLQPDEEDAKLVAHYIKWYKQYFFNEQYQRKLDERSIDVDSGCNTIVFAKKDHGWVYCVASWQNQHQAPSKFDEKQYPTLMELINSVRGVGRYEYQHPRGWETFLANNPL